MHHPVQFLRLDWVQNPDKYPHSFSGKVKVFPSKPPQLIRLYVSLPHGGSVLSVLHRVVGSVSGYRTLMVGEPEKK